MIRSDGDRAVWAIDAFDSGVGWMTPPSFYAIALSRGGADFAVACLAEQCVEFLGGQNFASDLWNPVDTVFIEGHSCFGSWYRCGIQGRRGQCQWDCGLCRDMWVREDYHRGEL